MDSTLIIPAFIAGLLTFLAPCTLPMIPAYLGFISGVSLNDLQDPLQAKKVRRKIFFNGILYILGFSLVFILFGTLFSLGGGALIKYRHVMQQVGGILVITFGLYMLKVIQSPRLSFLGSEHRFPLAKVLKPGKPINSFLFGAAFAFGWSPCIGPILGSILTLAASSTTVASGALLLMIFSLGLSLPFLLIAAGIGSASSVLNKLSRLLEGVSIVGGVFLVVLGLLMVFNLMGVWVGLFYKLFQGVNYDTLLNYL
ncbi:sulfite exporter TauE/SafE family protein [Candidatus Uhrbacteria bacterium]|nr:sulfite exporter TauE/SafE family protein [Candidatus Uhrbacteria bacterium]